MSCLRPVTPGFIVSLVATLCLAIISYSVPFLKSVYFVKVNISIDNCHGTITLGTLGYCLDLCNNNGTTCSKPLLGYVLDLSHYNLPVQIPQLVAKGATHTMVFHLVALIVSAISTLFALFAHIRELPMIRYSTHLSGYAAGVSIVAFVADLILFFTARSRISGHGSVSPGFAIGLPLVAIVLLLLSGASFVGVSKRPSGFMKIARQDDEGQLGLGAVRARAGAEALQHKPEGGAFDEEQSLTTRVDGESAYLESFKDNQSATLRTGYPPAYEGTQAIDGDSSTTTSIPPTIPPPQPFILPPPPVNQSNNVSQYYTDPFSPPAYGHRQ